MLKNTGANPEKQQNRKYSKNASESSSKARVLHRTEEGPSLWLGKSTKWVIEHRVTSSVVPGHNNWPDIFLLHA